MFAELSGRVGVAVAFADTGGVVHGVGVAEGDGSVEYAQRGGGVAGVALGDAECGDRVGLVLPEHVRQPPACGGPVAQVGGQPGHAHHRIRVTQLGGLGPNEVGPVAVARPGCRRCRGLKPAVRLPLRQARSVQSIASASRPCWARAAPRFAIASGSPA